MNKAILLATAFFTFSTPAAHAETRTIRAAAVEIGGAKFWLPSTIVVKKGDDVVIQAVSKVAGAPGTTAHGFSIPAFKVEEVVDAKGKEIRFKADRAGIFPIQCQMHPAHFGGQLVVLE
jgi:nitrosocyanin